MVGQASACQKPAKKAGSILHHFSSNAGFLFLAAVAAAAFGILYFRMPETRDNRFLSPTL
jgi:hypothetical protein